jgi:hypothetical protein
VQVFSIVLPYGIDGGLVAFLASLFLFIGVSLITKPPMLDSDIETVLDI